MKQCDRCGKEANVFYQVTVNGKTEQKHLCAECARKEGIPMDFSVPSLSPFSLFPERMMEAFERPFSLFDSDFFALPTLAPKQINPAQKSEEQDKSAQANASSAPSDAPTSPASSAPSNATANAGTASLPTLKAQLKRAVKQEDYLRAASLRDQIRSMEGK